MSPMRNLGIASPWQAGVGDMDKARFDTRGKLAPVLYALLIFIVGAAIAGATGWWGGLVFLLCVGTAAISSTGASRSAGPSTTPGREPAAPPPHDHRRGGEH